MSLICGFFRGRVGTRPWVTLVRVLARTRGLFWVEFGVACFCLSQVYLVLDPDIIFIIGM